MLSVRILVARVINHRDSCSFHNVVAVVSGYAILGPRWFEMICLGSISLGYLLGIEDLRLPGLFHPDAGHVTCSVIYFLAGHLVKWIV